MIDPQTSAIVASSGLAGLSIVVAAALAGWRGWLALRHAELDRMVAAVAPPASASARIEIADLKERIRKLEAIAAGVEL